MLPLCCDENKISACKLFNFLPSFEVAFEIADFILGFRKTTVLLVSECPQSQQDCIARPLGGRQRYCASSDINPSDSLCRTVQKVQTERAENSPYPCLSRSLLCCSVKRMLFNNINNHPINFCKKYIMMESLLISSFSWPNFLLSHCLSIFNFSQVKLLSWI